MATIKAHAAGGPRREGIKGALERQVLDVAVRGLLKRGVQPRAGVQKLRVVIADDMRNTVDVFLVKIGNIFSVS